MIVRRLFAGVLLAGLAVSTLGAAARPGAAPDPSPLPAAAAEPEAGRAATPPSPEIAARARAAFDAYRSGKIDRSRYTAEMNARLSDALLAQGSAALQTLGPVKAFTQVRKITHGSMTVYVFRIEFEKPPLIEEAVAWDPSGKLDFIQFGAAQ